MVRTRLRSGYRSNYRRSVDSRIAIRLRDSVGGSIDPFGRRWKA